MEGNFKSQFTGNEIDNILSPLNKNQNWKFVIQHQAESTLDRILNDAVVNLVGTGPNNINLPTIGIVYNTNNNQYANYVRQTLFDCKTGTWKYRNKQITDEEQNPVEKDFDAWKYIPITGNQIDFSTVPNNTITYDKIFNKSFKSESTIDNLKTSGIYILTNNSDISESTCTSIIAVHYFYSLTGKDNVYQTHYDSNGNIKVRSLNNTTDEWGAWILKKYEYHLYIDANKDVDNPSVYDLTTDYEYGQNGITASVSKLLTVNEFNKLVENVRSIKHVSLLLKTYYNNEVITLNSFVRKDTIIGYYLDIIGDDIQTRVFKIYVENDTIKVDIKLCGYLG